MVYSVKCFRKINKNAESKAIVFNLSLPWSITCIIACSVERPCLKIKLFLTK